VASKPSPLTLALALILNPNPNPKPNPNPDPNPNPNPTNTNTNPNPNLNCEQVAKGEARVAAAEAETYKSANLSWGKHIAKNQAMVEAAVEVLAVSADQAAAHREIQGRNREILGDTGTIS